MNREIKFRVWNGSQMIDLGRLDVFHNSGGYGYSEPSTGARCGETTNGRYGSEKKVDFNLMQYTGLKDCNGVEIYEGDIVHCYTLSPIGETEQEAIFEVEFNYGSFLALTASDNQEVIGNIHENPGLLTK